MKISENLICKYLLKVEEPDYDQYLKDEGNVLHKNFSLGPWTGRKRIFGRQVIFEVARSCSSCDYSRPMTINGTTDYYCSYRYDNQRNGVG